MKAVYIVLLIIGAVFAVIGIMGVEPNIQTHNAQIEEMK